VKENNYLRRNFVIIPKEMIKWSQYFHHYSQTWTVKEVSCSGLILFTEKLARSGIKGG
jgi:hypothetical protein